MSRRFRAIVVAAIVAASGRALGASKDLPVKKNAIAAVAALSLSGCSLWRDDVKPAVDTAIDCAKAEAAVATSGKSVTAITVDVLNNLSDALQKAIGGDYSGALDAAASALFAKYGEPIVACVLHGTEPSTSAQAKAMGQPNPIAVVIAKHGWKFAK